MRSGGSQEEPNSEEMVRRIETQVQAEPIPIAGRRMTTASDEPGPSSVPSDAQTTPKLDKTYFDEKLCYAPSRGNTKRRIELCKTILPVLESPLSPPLMREGRLWICRWYNPKVVGSMLLSTYKMRCLTLISAPKGAQAVWFVENLWTK